VWCGVNEKTVDAKLSPDEQLGLSGKGLSLLVTIAIVGVATWLDLMAGRGFGLQSLVLPLCLSAILTAGLGFWAVPLLQQLKAGQFIREDGPQTHFKKAGTPTMGGVFVIPVAVAIALLSTGFSPLVVAASALTLAYGAIGWLDDWQILRRKSNKGISPRLKLALQTGFAALFCLWVTWQHPLAITQLALPFGWVLPLGGLLVPIAWFALVAESNATNLTDGLDGLAAGTGAIALLGLSALAAPTAPDIMVFCACMSGGYLGFLAHNRNPARVFMGDTGSLALGGALAAAAILSHSLLGLFILSGVFLAETLSVIAQVSYYKATKDEHGIGKRLFKMAPLHHHLELTGWSEIQIVIWFYILTAVLAFLCFILYL
jgi:phospho-N-acetylmuramoyl-pentapeptide-transferase